MNSTKNNEETMIKFASQNNIKQINNAQNNEKTDLSFNIEEKQNNEYLTSINLNKSLNGIKELIESESENILERSNIIKNIEEDLKKNKQYPKKKIHQNIINK